MEGRQRKENTCKVFIQLASSLKGQIELSVSMTRQSGFFYLTLFDCIQLLLLLITLTEGDSSSTLPSLRILKYL